MISTMRDLTPAEASFLQGLKKSPNDFDCLTLSMQVAFFARYLVERGEASFAVEDIRTLFLVADMKAPRSGRPVRPSNGQLVKALDALAGKGAVTIRRNGDRYDCLR
jgi:hypothetical protein